MSKFMNIALGLTMFGTLALGISNQMRLSSLLQHDARAGAEPMATASANRRAQNDVALRRDFLSEKASQRARLSRMEAQQRQLEQKLSQVETALSTVRADLAQLAASADSLWNEPQSADQEPVETLRTETQSPAWSESEFWVEAIDHAWSDATYASVSTALRDAGVGDTSIEAVECHQTACRLTFVHPGGRGDGAFLHSIQTIEPFSQEFISDSWVDARGDEVTLVYLARPGVSLSSSKLE